MSRPLKNSSRPFKIIFPIRKSRNTATQEPDQDTIFNILDLFYFRWFQGSKGQKQSTSIYFIPYDMDHIRTSFGLFCIVPIIQSTSYGPYHMVYVCFHMIWKDKCLVVLANRLLLNSTKLFHALTLNISISRADTLRVLLIHFYPKIDNDPILII